MADSYAHPSPVPETQTETCGECGHQREVEGIVEYGRWTPIDEDDLKICPDCGHNIMED